MYLNAKKAYLAPGKLHTSSTHTKHRLTQQFLDPGSYILLIIGCITAILCVSPQLLCNVSHFSGHLLCR